MRISKSAFFLAVLFFCAFKIISAQTNFYVSAESPQAVNGTIEISTDFNIDIYIDNELDPPEDWCGGSMSFIFYSPDATITDVNHVFVEHGWGTSSSIEFLNGFDTQYFNDFIAIIEFGWNDGVLPDSINFAFCGGINNNECMPVSAPNQAYIRFNMNIGQEGIFCIDSLDYPAGNDYTWDWLFFDQYRVEFNGPYCWSVTPCFDDADCDGFITAEDNCPLIANPDQADIDDDGFGDVCDNCPFHSNSDQIDSNFDEIGDVCTFEEPTPPGQDVLVALGTDVEMTYENVSTEGVTQLTETISGPTVTNFKFLPIKLSKILSLTTTSTRDGEIETCITYDDFDIGEDREDSLVMRHFNGSTWEIIPTSINTTTNVICGITTSLSSFVVGGPDYMCGDVNPDGAVNILDIVFIINYKYKNGPSSFLYAGMDVNNDKSINILDIVHLLNYKYKDGPPPNCW